MPTFTEADIMALVSPVFWPFLRVLAVFSSAPIFSARSVPMRTRVALALLWAMHGELAWYLIPPGLFDASEVELLGKMLETGLHAHDADSCLFVARHDGPLDRCRAPPPGKE